MPTHRAVNENRPAWLAAYAGVAVADAVVAGLDRRRWQPRRRVTKPLLMPLLHLAGRRDSPLLTVAHASSWVGDVALLADDDDGWFRRGVYGFTATHLAYAAALAPSACLDASGRRRAASVAAVSAVSAAALARDARRSRPALAGTVGGYSLVIGSMAAIAAAVPAGAAGAGSLRAGALLFLASDSLIGATTFTVPDADRRLETVVMLTYTAGQLLLARGVEQATDA